MWGTDKSDVLVAGAGPVGLFTALSLVRRGAKVRVIDESWRPAAHSYALALHPNSVELFAEAGLEVELLEHAHVIDKIAVYDNRAYVTDIDVSQLHVSHPFVAVVPQDALESILESALHRLDASVEWNHRVAGLRQSQADVEVEIERLARDSRGYAVAHMEWIVDKRAKRSFPLVVGADGHASTVRSALGIEFKSVDTPRYFAVFEFEIEDNLGATMSVVIGDDTTSVLWPLPNGRCRWSFELTDVIASPYTRAKNPFIVQMEESPLLTDENLHRLIETRAPWFDANIKSVLWKTIACFERRLASSFGSGRVWLVGDAAHMAAPCGVQSMNVGLREGREIADLVADIVLHGSDPHRFKALEAFGAARIREWDTLLGLDAHALPVSQIPPWLHDKVDQLVTAIPASGENLERLLTQFLASAGAVSH